MLKVIRGLRPLSIFLIFSLFIYLKSLLNNYFTHGPIFMFNIYFASFSGFLLISLTNIFLKNIKKQTLVFD